MMDKIQNPVGVIYLTLEEIGIPPLKKDFN